MQAAEAEIYGPKQQKLPSSKPWPHGHPAAAVQTAEALRAVGLLVRTAAARWRLNVGLGRIRVG